MINIYKNNFCKKDAKNAENMCFDMKLRFLPFFMKKCIFLVDINISNYYILSDGTN